MRTWGRRGLALKIHQGNAANCWRSASQAESGPIGWLMWVVCRDEV